MSVFKAMLNKDSLNKGDFVKPGDLDLNTDEETRWQDLQEKESRDLFAVVCDARWSNGTQHESDGHNFSQA